MYQSCEISECHTKRACFHYCLEHHNDICINGKSPKEIAENLRKKKIETRITKDDSTAADDYLDYLEDQW